MTFDPIMRPGRTGRAYCGAAPQEVQRFPFRSAPLNLGNIAKRTICRSLGIASINAHTKNCKRKDSAYRSGRSPDWLNSKNAVDVPARAQRSKRPFHVHQHAGRKVSVELEAARCGALRAGQVQAHGAGPSSRSWSSGSIQVGLLYSPHPPSPEQEK